MLVIGVWWTMGSAASCKRQKTGLCQSQCIPSPLWEQSSGVPKWEKQIVQKAHRRTPYARPRAFGKPPTVAQAKSEATVNVFPYECGALKSDLLKEKSDGSLKNRAGVSGCGRQRRA